MASALRLARQADPRLATVNLALQLVAVLLLGAQVLLAKVAITAILEEAGGGGVDRRGAAVPDRAGDRDRPRRPGHRAPRPSSSGC